MWHILEAATRMYAKALGGRDQCAEQYFFSLHALVIKTAAEGDGTTNTKRESAKFMTRKPLPRAFRSSSVDSRHSTPTLSGRAADKFGYRARL